MGRAETEFSPPSGHGGAGHGAWGFNRLARHGASTINTTGLGGLGGLQLPGWGPRGPTTARVGA